MKDAELMEVRIEGWNEDEDLEWKEMKIEGGDKDEGSWDEKGMKIKGWDEDKGFWMKIRWKLRVGMKMKDLEWKWDEN